MFKQLLRQWVYAFRDNTWPLQLDKFIKEYVLSHLFTLPSKSLETPLAKCGFGRYHTSKLDPKHTSKLCKSYLERKQSAGIMSVMEWPPQSPDLNSQSIYLSISAGENSLYSSFKKRLHILFTNCKQSSTCLPIWIWIMLITLFIPDDSWSYDRIYILKFSGKMI